MTKMQFGILTIAKSILLASVLYGLAVFPQGFNQSTSDSNTKSDCNLLPQSTSRLSEAPLIYKSNLQFVGAFRVPNDFNNIDGFSYGGSALAYNPAGPSLFITGLKQSLAEISIPTTLSASDKLTDLPVAKTLQSFTPVLPRLQNKLQGATDGESIGGMVIRNGKLICSNFAYYSGANNQSLSHFIVDSLQLSAAKVHGMYKVNGLNNSSPSSNSRIVAGCMTPIPSEWQRALEATYLTGLANQCIISTVSSGPCAFGFNPDNLGNNPTPSIPYVYYPATHSLGPYEKAINPINSGTSQIRGVIFPPKTNAILFFGSTGTNYNGYGAPGAWGNAHSVMRNGTGPHSLNGEYAYQVWAYDANDFFAVKGRVKWPWDIVPYAVWNFTVPIQGSIEVGGVDFDPVTNRIFVCITNVDRLAPYSSLPIILVFKLSFGAQKSTDQWVGTLAATPNLTMPAPGPIPIGTSVTLTAGNVYAVKPKIISKVKFYRGSQLLGEGTQSRIPNGEHNWSLVIQTTGMKEGNYTISAQATDSAGAVSDSTTTVLRLRK